ncbi:hypothetical protein H310_09297 [Aphanomyces invadans]|uniref:Prolyl 4-hydroxylase alpha subunit domain-containing protein n=1 Tax=Aphanomyces invadans TaxID=157072 RepID=A0A024TVJ5_9STRA|nr:hypothetical protein H310_09297 [Aphanomyces invadans]ETV97994.1 hypothetical protein H310_09297 [Aphanomyces invadans]|eukprot:XP_008873555.1 hypothetical protein H310_09297 [Aphanomyces invadans]
MAVEKTTKGKKLAATRDDQPEAEENSRVPSPAQKKRALASGGGSIWGLRLVGVAALVAAIAYATSILTVRDLPVLVRSLIGSDTSVPSSIPASAFDPVGNKYASEIVKISTRKLLVPDASCTATPAILGDLAHVDTALGRANELRAENKVFLLLNGQNDGLYVEWSKDSACLHALAATAATALGANPDYFPNGLRLYNGMGLPISTTTDLDTERLAYILIDFQIWVWPGIRVGYVRQVGNVTMKTISLSPLVFDCEGFFNLDEANAIIAHGSDKLTRSPVDSPDAVDGYHADRTSNTAFLDDTQFTRDFRTRTAALARLPSPSFVERMQLVRYEAGQFFRKHEDYFESKDFLGKKNDALKDYKTWAAWAAASIDVLEDKSTLPEAFHRGHPLYPAPDDIVTWQLALLEGFLADTLDTSFYSDHGDQPWADWLLENFDNQAHGIIDTLLKDKEYMLDAIIASWEKRVDVTVHPTLHYVKPKEAPSAVTQYFRWIRWAKERVDDLGDEAPVHVRPDGKDYPSYRLTFQNKLVEYILKDKTPDELDAFLGPDWAAWLDTNKDSIDVLLDGLRLKPELFSLAVDAWTKRAGPGLFDYDVPQYLHHFEPNRFVTLFLYLNDVDEGGETVFPYSKERLVTNIERQGMDECSEGLAVPPTKLHASLFYAQTPENNLDPLSLHGGCPPSKGVKFGANSFTWNADADEGSVAWGF